MVAWILLAGSAVADIAPPVSRPFDLGRDIQSIFRQAVLE